MNLLEILQKDFDKEGRDKIVRFISGDKVRFSGLVDAFLNQPYRITQRAAWPLSQCVRQHPDLIKPHLKKIIVNLREKGLSDAVKRNTLRLLQYIQIPEKLQGLTFDICFALLQHTKEPVAIRVFSMSVLANLTKAHPELKRELIAIIEAQMPYGSAGFVSRGKKVLRQLRTD